MVNTVQPYAVSDTNVTHVVIEMFGGDNNLTISSSRTCRRWRPATRGRKFAVIALADFADAGRQILEITPSDGLQIVEELGEIDTGDPEVLARLPRPRAHYLSEGPQGDRVLGSRHGRLRRDRHRTRSILDRAAIRSVAAPHREPLASPRDACSSRRATIDGITDTRAMLHDDTNGGVLTNARGGAMLRRRSDAGHQTARST